MGYYFTSILLVPWQECQYTWFRQRERIHCRNLPEFVYYTGPEHVAHYRCELHSKLVKDYRLFDLEEWGDRRDPRGDLINLNPYIDE